MRITIVHAFRKHMHLLVWVLCAIVLFIQHKAFIQYVCNIQVLKNIWWNELFSTFLLTPLLFCVCVLSFWIIGKKTIHILTNNHVPCNEYCAIFFVAIGMGVSNTALALCGWIGILYAPVIIIFLIGGCILAVRDIKHYKGFIEALKNAFPENMFQYSMMVICITAIFYGVITALSPPISWDAMACHLPIPQLYADAHKIVRIPMMLQYQCVIIGMEMITCAALLINQIVLSQLLPLLAGLLILGLLYIFSIKYFSKKVAWASMVLFSVLPISLYLNGIVNNDMPCALFSCLAVIAIWEYFQSNNAAWLTIAALSSGLCAQTKMTGLIIAGFIMVFVLILLIRKKISLRIIIGGALIFIVCASPMYVKNMVLSKNPVYPMMYNIFGGEQIAPSVLMNNKYNDRETVGIKPSLFNLITLPYHMIVHYERFYNEPRYFVIFICIIGLLRILIRKKLLCIEIYLMSFIASFGLVWFFSGHHLWRYALPVIPLLIMLSAAWCYSIAPPKMNILATIILCINLVPLVQKNVNNNLFAVCALPSIQKPMVSPQERYLEMSLDYYAIYKYINTHLPENSTVLLFREIRSFYLRKKFVLGDPLKNVILYHEMKTIDELHQKLDALGITHIVVNNNCYPVTKYYYTSHVMRLMYGFINAHCSLILQDNGVELYQVKISGDT